MTEEKLILVNEKDVPVGSMEKMQAHREGILHRAFSVFIFNHQGEMLLQQRAQHKYHSGGLWSNACCSHPRPGEETHQAASRRLKEEMGFQATLEKVFDLRYRVELENGIIENELDHVFAGFYHGKIKPDPEEVEAFTFRKLPEIKNSLQNQPGKYTAWFHLAFPVMENWWNEKNKMKTVKPD